MPPIEKVSRTEEPWMQPWPDFFPKAWSLDMADAPAEALMFAEQAGCTPEAVIIAATVVRARWAGELRGKIGSLVEERILGREDIALPEGALGELIYFAEHLHDWMKFSYDTGMASWYDLEDDDDGSPSEEDLDRSDAMLATLMM